MTSRLIPARSRHGVAALSLAATTWGCTAGAPPITHAPRTTAAPVAISRTLLLRRDLPNLPGWETRLYLIEYPPGAAAPVHRHPVEGLGYVVSGRFESAFEGEHPMLVKAGESFVERAHVAHTLFRNPDPLRPLTFVIAFVAARGAPVVVTP
jgi:quercetin dioxygenase-like cupin family protein